MTTGPKEIYRRIFSTRSRPSCLEVVEGTRSAVSPRRCRRGVDELCCCFRVKVGAGTRLRVRSLMSGSRNPAKGKIVRYTYIHDVAGPSVVSCIISGKI